MRQETAAQLTRDLLTPRRDAAFEALCAPIRDTTLRKVREAQNAYDTARSEAVATLSHVGFGASFVLVGLGEIAGIKGLKEEFPYKEAATYTPKDGEAMEAPSLPIAAFKLTAAHCVQSCASNSSKFCDSLNSHGRYFAQLESAFEEMKAAFIKSNLEPWRALCLEISADVSTLGAGVLTLVPSHQSKVEQLGLLATALSRYARESLGAPKVTYDEVTARGLQPKTVPTAMFLERIQEVVLDLLKTTSSELPKRAPAIQDILKRHGEVVAELPVEQPSRLTADQSLILRHFSLRESLENTKLEPMARREYLELAEIVALSIVELTRKDRADAVKHLYRLSKQVGWNLIPDGIDESYWATLHVAAPAPAAREECYQPVKEALAPFLKGGTIRMKGITPGQLEKFVREGTVEKTIAALTAVVQDQPLSIAILSSNPQLFVDFQNDVRSFLRFTQLLQEALPKVEAASSQGRPPLPARLSSSDAILGWMEGERRIDEFRATKAAMVEVLRDLGFTEPELALIVLRAGCLKRGSYITVSMRTFDDFAKKAIPTEHQHKVSAIREKLVRVGLIEQGHGNQMALSSRTEGDTKTLLRWIKVNLPTADLDLV
jgi:hypothetical protein